MHKPKPTSVSGSINNTHKNHQYYFNQKTTYVPSHKQMQSTSSHFNYPYPQNYQQKLFSNYPYHTHFHRTQSNNKNDSYDHGRSFIQVDIQGVYEISENNQICVKETMQNQRKVKIQIQSGKVKTQKLKCKTNRDHEQKVQIMDYTNKSEFSNKNSNRYTYKGNQPIKIQETLSTKNLNQYKINQMSSQQKDNTNLKNSRRLNSQRPSIFGKQKQKLTQKQKQNKQKQLQTEQKISELRYYIQKNKQSIQQNENLSQMNDSLTPLKKLRQRQFNNSQTLNNSFNNFSTLRQKNTSSSKIYAYNLNSTSRSPFPNDKTNFTPIENNQKQQQYKNRNKIQSVSPFKLKYSKVTEPNINDRSTENIKNNLKYQKSTTKINQVDGYSKNSKLQQKSRTIQSDLQKQLHISQENRIKQQLKYKQIIKSMENETKKSQKIIQQQQASIDKAKNTIQQLLNINRKLKEQLIKMQQKNKEFQSIIIKPVTSNSNISQPQPSHEQENQQLSLQQLNNIMETKLQEYGNKLKNKIKQLQKRCMVLQKSTLDLQSKLYKSTYNKSDNKQINKHAYLNLSVSRNKCSPHEGEQQNYNLSDNSEIKISQIRNKTQNSQRYDNDKKKQSIVQSQIKQQKYVGSIVEIESKIRYKYNNMSNSAVNKKQIRSKADRKDKQEQKRQKSTNTPQKWNQQHSLSTSSYKANPNTANYMESKNAGNFRYSKQLLAKREQKQRQQLLLRISQLQSLLVIEQHKSNIKIQQLQKTNTKKLIQLQEKNKNRQIQILQKHRQQLSQIQNIYINKLKQIQQMQIKQRQKIDNQYKETIKQFDGTNGNRFNQLENINTQKLKQLEQQYKKQLISIKQQFKKQIQNLSQEHINQVNTWQQKQRKYKDNQIKAKNNQIIAKQKYNLLTTKLQKQQIQYNQKFKDIFTFIKQVAKQLQNCNVKNFSDLQKQIKQMTEQKKHLIYKFQQYKHKYYLQQQIYKDTKVWRIQQQLNENNKKMRDISKNNKELVQKCVRLQNYIQKNIDHGEGSTNFVIEGVYDGYADDFQSISENSDGQEVFCQCPIDKISNSQFSYDQDQGKLAIKWVAHVEKTFRKSLKIASSILKIEQELKKQDFYDESVV